VQTAHANAMLAGLAYFERARLEEALGQPDVARAYHAQFLRRLDMLPDGQRRLVTDAR